MLAELDLVVAAVHSAFKQGRAEMTRRLCRALAHPRVHILAHPTGRLIGERAPYDLDLDRVLETARRHGKAVEINAYPQRLDLNDVHARRAHELGTLVAIDSDTHVLDHLDNLELGVATARRGWIEKTAVVNTRPAKELVAWTRQARAARGGARTGPQRSGALDRAGPDREWLDRSARRRATCGAIAGEPLLMAG